MPVQINELVIRANVVQDAGAKGGSGTGGAQASPSGGKGDADKDEIIKECVAIVMELMNNKMQR